MLKFILLVGGGVLCYLGYQEWSLAASANATPEEITLKKLIERGPDGNPNVVITDFALGNNFVTSSRRGRWTKVWVPVVPREDIEEVRDKGVKVESIRAILCSTQVRTAEEIQTRMNLPKVRGMVINKVASLNSGEKEQLKTSYSNIDFDRCLIIEEGREPADVLKLSLYFGGGALCILIGVFLLLRPRQPAPAQA